MSSGTEPFAFWIRQDGSIPPGQSAPRTLPENVRDLLAPWSRAKARVLLETVGTDAGVFDWDLDLGTSDDFETVRVVAAAADGGCVISCAANAAAAFAELEVWTRDRDDRGEILGAAARAYARSKEALGGSDEEAFRQLWRVNSEIAATHRELVRSNRELERMRNALNQTLGMVAHDLRSPLQVLKFTIAFLTDPDIHASRTSQLATQAEGSIKAIVGLIDDLLDLHAIETGTLRIDRRRCHLNEIVDRTCRTIAWTARERGVRIVWSDEAGPVEAFVDPGRVEQVLTNLLDNAIRHTRSDSEVVVQTVRNATGVEIRVSDRGPGPPEDGGSKMFEAHHQGERGGRAGLGLAIVSRIVAVHGGALRWDERPGGGSTFIASFPDGSGERDADARTALPSAG